MTNGKQGQLRIIGGQWRGRKLRFPPLPELRPTPDRVRETVFNWLAPFIEGADCLDLFAGSGALGLEALSRGAGSCDFVDSQRDATTTIHEHLVDLDYSEHGECINAKAERFLSRGDSGRSYDLVFLDPPFGAGVVTAISQLLEAEQWLRHESYVYLENSSTGPQPTLPPNWETSRDKKAGDVRYRLFVRQREFV